VADRQGPDNEDESESPSIFDLFEPPPEPDPGTFGKIPVVRGDDKEFDRRSGTTAAERKTAAEAEAAGLQHWTAPATGQIPAVFGSEDKEKDLWSDVKGPSWQSDDPTWSGPDLAEVFAGSENDDLGGDEEDEPATPPPKRLSPSSGGSTTQRVEIDDWAADRRPLPPTDTSEGRPLPGAEPPADLDSTEISSLRRPTDPAAQASRRSVEPPVRPEAAWPETPRPEAARSHVDPRIISAPRPVRRSVSLERSAEPPRPPGLRPRPEPEVSGADQLGRSMSETRRPTAEEPRSTSFPDADPTAPGLFGDSAESRYFGDDPQHGDDFLDDDRPGGRNLPQAVVTGVVLAGLVLAALWVGAEAMMVVVAGAAVLGAIELYNAMRLAGLRPATLLGLAGTAALPVAAYIRGDAAYTLIATLMVVFGVLWYLAGADSERPVLNLSLTMLGVFWIGGLGAFAALILRDEEFGIPLLLSTIGIAVASDTMAYFGGRAFGRRPFHSVSPNKTWEGTMTGFVFAVFVSFAMAVMPFTTMWDGRFLSALLLGAVVGILTPLGDLAESMVKRDLGVKDMGTIIPGHGGILDRVDGILFALPGAYYVALLAGIF